MVGKENYVTNVSLTQIVFMAVVLHLGDVIAYLDGVGCSVIKVNVRIKYFS